LWQHDISFDIFAERDRKIKALSLIGLIDYRNGCFQFGHHQSSSNLNLLPIIVLHAASFRHA
jgi:hypothetical protein